MLELPSAQLFYWETLSPKVRDRDISKRSTSDKVDIKDTGLGDKVLQRDLII